MRYDLGIIVICVYTHLLCQLDESMMEEVTKKKKKKKAGIDESVTEISDLEVSSTSTSSKKKKKSKRESSVKIEDIDLYGELPDLDEGTVSHDTPKRRSEHRKSKNSQEIAERSEDVDEVKAKLSELEKKYKTLKSTSKRDISSKNEEIIKLTTSLNELTETTTKIQSEDEIKTRELENLKTANQEFKSNASKLNDKIKKRDETIDALKKSLSLKENEIQQLKVVPIPIPTNSKESVDKDEEINSLHDKISSLEKTQLEQSDSDRKEIEELKERNVALQTELQEHNELAIRSKSKELQGKSEFEELQAQSANKDKEIEQLKKKLEEIKTTYEEKLKEELSDKENQIKRYKRTIEELKDDLENNTGHTASNFSAPNDLEDLIEDLQYTIQDKDREISRLKEDIEFYKEKAQEELTELNNMIINLKRENKELFDELENEQKISASKQEELMKLYHSQESYANEKSSSQRDIDDIIEQKNEEYEELKQAFNNMKLENLELSEKIEMLSEKAARQSDDSYDSSKELNKSTLIQIEDLQDQLDALKKKIVRVKKYIRYEDIDSDYSSDEEEISSDEEEIIEALHDNRDRIDDLERRLMAMDNKIPSSKSSIDSEHNQELESYKKLICTVYLVSNIESTRKLDPKLLEWADYLSKANLDSDDRLCKVTLDAFRNQALVINDPFYQFRWLSQVCLFRDMIITLQGLQLNSTSEDGLHKPPQIKSSFSSNTERFVFDIYCLSYKIFVSAMTIIHEKISILAENAILKLNNNDLKRLISYLSSLKRYFDQVSLPQFIVIKVLTQLMYYINICVFNKMVEDGSKYCRVENSFDMKLQMSQIEEWTSKNYPKYSDDLREELNYIYEAFNILVWNKDSLVDLEIRREVFPHINAAQLYFLAKNLQPDSIEPEGVSDQVLSVLYKRYKESNVEVKLDPFKE